MPEYSRLLIGQTESHSPRGVVTSKHPLATEAGLEVLDAGGNAIDAAVASALVSSVVLPFANGIGGGGYIVAYLARQKRVVVIDYSMNAPLAAREDMCELEDGRSGSPLSGDVDLGGKASPFGWCGVKENANEKGWRSMAVPGTLRGLDQALTTYGTMKLSDVLAPAIHWAEAGFELDWFHALIFSQQLETILKDPTSRSLYSRAGLPLRPRTIGPGDRVRNPALARTLRRIAEVGVDDLYVGALARDVVADMEAGGGLLTLKDLARYSSSERKPLVAPYRGCELFTVPYASAGPTLFEALNVLSGYDLPALGHNDPQGLHLMAEAFRQAYQDRLAYLADPQFVDVPWDAMVSEEYAEQVRRQIDPARARSRVAAGDLWAVEGREPAQRYAPSQPFKDSGTTHINVCDAEGNVVALTQTLLAWSGVVLPRTGIAMNNGMGWFDPEPGRANSIAPGKKPLTNMCPTIVLRDSKPFLGVGAPGGRRIVNAVAQVLMNVLDHGKRPGPAVGAPRLDANGPIVMVNGRVEADTVRRLKEMGHTPTVVEDSFAGNAFASPAAVMIDPETNMRYAGEDPYRTGVSGAQSE